MISLKRYVSAFAVAVAMCFASAGWASPVEVVYLVASDVGSFGKAEATFKIKQAYMLSQADSVTMQSNGLKRQSHGFMQASADDSTKPGQGSTVTFT